MFKEDAQKRNCEKFASIMDVGFYGMRSSPGVRSAKVLQEEFKGTIPEQINVIFVDGEQDEVSLLSSGQRGLFFVKYITPVTCQLSFNGKVFHVTGIFLPKSLQGGKNPPTPYYNELNSTMNKERIRYGIQQCRKIITRMYKPRNLQL